MCARRDRRRHGAAVALAFALALTATPAARPEAPLPTNAAPSAVFASASHEYRYALSARIRPLLFWIGKDNVGEARVGWLTGEKGVRGYALLIGSDPDRAPRAINRWGYIAEREDQTGVRVSGLMTEVDEETLEQAKASTGGELRRGFRAFKVIQATISGGQEAASIAGVSLPDRLTFRDVDAAVTTIGQLPSSARHVSVPPRTEPGFLFAMASLIHESVDTWQRTGRAPGTMRRSFVYAHNLYELRTRSSRLMEKATVQGQVVRNAIDSEFEVRNRSGNNESVYRVVCGTEGALREVPLRIVYRPKWWFEAELSLVGAPLGNRGR